MQHPTFIPIYQQLKEHYKNRIINQELLPGQGIDSINRIMLKHGVSRETAKLVLKLLIEEGLVISKQGKGSYVAPNPATNNQWGMVIPFYSSNLEQLIQFLEIEAGTRGKRLSYYLGYNNPGEETRLVGSMIREGFEAVIVVPNYDESLTADFYRRLIYGNTCVLLVDNTMSGSYFRYVVQSYDLGVKRAIDHLLANKSGNLLMVKSNTWKGRNMVEELMEQTFRNIVASSYPERHALIVHQVRELDRLFFLDNNICGILTTTDADAIRVLGRLKHWNIRVPEEARLVSYGNTELTLFFDPPITVIDCQYESMARLTAHLIDIGKNAGKYEQHIIQPELIVRGT